MKILHSLILSSIFATGTTNASIALFEDFEDSTISYTFAANDEEGTIDESTPAPLAGVERYIGRLRYDSIESHLTDDQLLNQQGDSFFGAQDYGGFDSSATLTWTGIDVSSFGTDYTFSAFFGEVDDGSNNDWDSDDSVTVWVNLDGSGFQQIFGLESIDSITSVNNAPAIDTNLNGVGDGAEITNTLTRYSVDIGSSLGAATTLDLEIRIQGLASANEDIAIDNVLIGVIPEPSSTLLLGLGGLSLFIRRKR